MVTQQLARVKDICFRCFVPFIALLLLLSLDFCAAQTVSVRFSGSELRDTLSQYARAQRIGFLLDRRVDPGLPLDFEARNLSVPEMLSRLADRMNLGYCQVGEIAYIGPKEAAVKLERILAVKQQALPDTPAAARRMLTQKIRLQTEKLDTPQEILQQVAQRMRTRIENLDRLPHDLWPELDFPEADAYELLSVLLIGFDLTFEMGDRGITLVPVPDHLPPIPRVATANQRTQAAPPPAKNAPLERQRFQLELKNQTVGEVLKYFSSNLDLQMEVDEKALREKGISLDQRISFQLEQADIHELLRSTLDPVGCTYQLTGKKVRVFPKK